MRENSSKEGFRGVLDAFEALAQNLDALHAVEDANGSNPKVIARIRKAKALASRGSAVCRQHMDDLPDQRVPPSS